jgi:hypothetical protein
VVLPLTVLLVLRQQELVAVEVAHILVLGINLPAQVELADQQL